MSEKPILFNTEKVRAILSGRQTQTRRIVKPPPPAGKKPMVDTYYGMYGYGIGADEKWTPCAIGDVLWVRETWKSATGDPAGGGYALFDTYVYKADGKAKDDYPVDELMVEDRWHPSIHMPREAARIFLRVKDVRTERLQDISEDDVCCEGAEEIILSCQHMDWGETPPEPCFNTRPCADCIINYSYPELFGKMVWNPTIQPKDLPIYGWDANPWVWVINFEKIDRPEAQT